MNANAASSSAHVTYTNISQLRIFFHVKEEKLIFVNKQILLLCLYVISTIFLKIICRNIDLGYSCKKALLFCLHIEANSYSARQAKELLSAWRKVLT